MFGRGDRRVRVVSFPHATSHMSTSATQRPGAPPVILVDESDRFVGRSEKLAAHEAGTLHRAVSVFAFDSEGALLIQRRAPLKYHSGGLWSNSACTHPRDGEPLINAARRCIREELGVECATIDPVFSFIYRAQVSPLLVEHEFDHVFVATIDGVPSPNPDEVEMLRRSSLGDISREVAQAPHTFSAWFPLALERLLALGSDVLPSNACRG